MPTARLIQPVVNGGEISPEYRGRTDVVKYQTALARARNLRLRAGGGADNRPGLQMITFAADEGHPPVFVEFEGDDGGNSYMLVFGHFTMQVFQGGGYVLYPDGHAQEGEPVVIVSPFSAERAQLIEYDQSNDVITIVTGDDDVQELKRFDHHVWTFAVQQFAVPTNVPTGINVTATAGYTDGPATDPYVDDHTYAVTAILEPDARETILSASDMVSNRLGWPQNFNTITWAAPVGVTVREYAVYKQRNTLWGQIGITDALTFKDDNIAPNWALGPPKSRNPFVGSDQKPRTVAYFQQRRVFGGMRADPFILEGTRSAQLNNMGTSEPLRDDDSFTIPMSGPKRQSIVALVALDDLLVFTTSGEWYLTGDDEVVTPKSFARPATNYGSEPIRPIVAGNRILMVERLGKIVRDIAFSFEAQGYESPEDRSIFVQHYFKGRKIIGWAYQPEIGLIWIYCDDGAFFTFTYLPAHDVWGWSMQQTSGRVEAIKSVREDSETAVYFAMRRRLGGEWRRTIEYLHSRNFTTIKDAFFVDCGVSYDNPLSVELIELNGNIDLTITAHGIDDGAPLDAEVTGLVSVEDEEVFLAGEYFAEVVSVDVIRLVNADGNPISPDGWARYDDGGVIREKVSELEGWEHLAGMPIAVLADGAVVDDIVVDNSGGISLPHKAGRVHGGLRMTAEWETLELKRGEQTTEGIIKSVEATTLRVHETRGLEIGPSWDTLNPPATRDGEDYGPSELSNADIPINFDAEWNDSARVCIRQSDPLPATILAIIPTVVYGGE